MDLYIQYRVPGSFRDTELYRKSPVKVWVHSGRGGENGVCTDFHVLQSGETGACDIKQEDEEWTQEVSKLPLVFPTPIGGLYVLGCRLCAGGSGADEGGGGYGGIAYGNRSGIPANLEL